MHLLPTQRSNIKRQLKYFELSFRNAPLSVQEKAELHALADNTEELKSRFDSELAFGTAGMRGVMGLGSNRLNRYTVRRAAQGMAAWLSGTQLPKKAAIGYDSRHNSELFAQVRRGIC